MHSKCYPRSDYMYGIYFTEMCYDDVFLVWESIWSAKYVCCDSYVAFIALAMVEAYRDILLDNSMDFIDVMKFFNGKNPSL